MKLTGIQMLRFAAALLVAVMHITQAISVHLTGQGPGAYWAQGSAGVDLFFVISGFVMGITTPPRAATWRARAHQAWQFLQRRLIRVLPLYWGYTLLKAALVLGLPALALRTELDGAHLAASLAFLPWPSPWGAIEPVLPVGWTLNFEMLFYLLFALAVLLGLPRLASCLVVFLLLIALARWQLLWPALEFWGSPIVLEFVLGVGLARLHQRGLRPPPEAGLLALGLGLVWMFALPWTAQDGRLLSWGLGAALVVAGALWLEPWAARLPGAPALAFLGDASYSLYLLHLPLSGLLLKAILASGLRDRLGGAAAYALTLSLTAALAWLAYRAVEAPLLRGLRKWGPRRSAALPFSRGSVSNVLPG